MNTIVFQSTLNDFQHYSLLLPHQHVKEQDPLIYKLFDLLLMIQAPISKTILQQQITFLTVVFSLRAT